jgi:hypothetical protein
MSDSTQSEDFWCWFQNSSNRLKSMLDEGDIIALARELNMRVDGIDRRIGWEIGPGTERAMAFTLGADEYPELHDLVDSMIACAPQLADWEFRAWPQPLTSPRHFRLPENYLEFGMAPGNFRH